jgi:hypothetical protein
MPNAVINRFLGIAPGQLSAAGGANTQATIAQDCRLTRGVLEPRKEFVHIEGGHRGAEFAMVNDKWVSGVSCPVVFRYKSKEVLIHKGSNGRWLKRVEDTDYDLGLPLPNKPSLSTNMIPAPGVPEAEPVTVSQIDGIQRPLGDRGNIEVPVLYRYYATYSRIFEGEETEGEYSIYPPVSIKYEDDQLVRIKRPASGGYIYYRWNLYRSENGSVPRLVVSLPYADADENPYVDDLPIYELGRYMPVRGVEDNYRMVYVITWERDLGGGMIDESGPSMPAEINQYAIGAQVSRPLAAPTGVTGWNIYRVSIGYEPTTEFKLVARVPISELSYIDQRPSVTLGVAIPTSIENADGTVVNYEPPPEDFDGIAGPHHGMFFGWKSGALYASESGKPDAWSSFWKSECSGKIISCQSGAELTIMTDRGVQRGIGTRPDQFYVSVIGADSEAAIYRRASVQTEAGVFFLCPSGVAMVEGGHTEVISDRVLGPDYFKDLEEPFMAYHDGELFVFHSKGAVIFDMRARQWTTSSVVAKAAWHATAKGMLGVLVGGSIRGIHSGSGVGNFIYETGDIILNTPKDKEWRRLRFFGDGEVYATAIVDGIEVTEQTLLDMSGKYIRDTELSIPNNVFGRAIRVRVIGSGAVREILMEVDIPRK